MERLLDGGTFFEGPRWHDGRWWVSDFYRHVVLSFDATGGDVREEARVASQPSGLGWTPDGSLLVVSMLDQRLLRRPVGGGADDLEVFADLSAIATGHCNDMVVSADGHAYVGNFGFDFWKGAPFQPAALIHVTPGGEVRVGAEELRFPNGSVITPDGSTLIVGESFGGRYTAFSIDPSDGSLSDRRVWAGVPGVAPDGCGLDAAGRIWCADAIGKRCVLVAEGGEIVDELAIPEDLGVFACMLGGADGRTLLACAAPDSDHERRAAADEAVLLVTEVAVPRAGLP
jgi:sugar lactone lactonase YvrE